MLLVCKALQPTLPEARRLGKHYLGGNQTFAVVVGRNYVAYGLRFWSGGIWVDIEVDAGYVLSVPLALFDLVDGSVPSIWEMRVDEDGDSALCPRAFHEPYFLDDLIEAKPDAVMQFRELKAEMNSLAGGTESRISLD